MQTPDLYYNNHNSVETSKNSIIIDLDQVGELVFRTDDAIKKIFFLIEAILSVCQKDEYVKNNIHHLQQEYKDLTSKHFDLLYEIVDKFQDIDFDYLTDQWWYYFEIVKDFKQKITKNLIEFMELFETDLDDFPNFKTQLEECLLIIG